MRDDVLYVHSIIPKRYERDHSKGIAANIDNPPFVPVTKIIQGRKSASKLRGRIEIASAQGLVPPPRIRFPPTPERCAIVTKYGERPTPGQYKSPKKTARGTGPKTVFIYRHQPSGQPHQAGFHRSCFDLATHRKPAQHQARRPAPKMDHNQNF